jgi:predicted DNA-binding transcriptional regulator YafY
VPPRPWEGSSGTDARIAFGPKSAWWVERRTPARRIRDLDDGWVEVALPVGDPATFVTWVLGFADDAELLSPDDLREAILAKLRSAGA